MNLPGGDPRFGPADGAPAPQPGPTVGAFGAPATGFGAPATGRAAFAATPVRAPGPRPKVGTPRWLVVAVVGLVALAAASMFGIYQHQQAQAAAKRVVFDHTTVAIPSSALGLERGVGPGVESAESRVNLALAQGGEVDPVSGAFLDADGNSYAFVAAARRATTPGDLAATARSTAKRFSSGIGSAGAAPVTVGDVPAGSLGGVMQCGTTSIASIDATYCVAVDQGSVVEVLVATGDATAGATAARGLREAVVKHTA